MAAIDEIRKEFDRVCRIHLLRPPEGVRLVYLLNEKLPETATIITEKNPDDRMEDSVGLDRILQRYRREEDFAIGIRRCLQPIYLSHRFRYRPYVLMKGEMQCQIRPAPGRPALRR